MGVFRPLCTSSLWAYPQEADKHLPYRTNHNKSIGLPKNPALVLPVCERTDLQVNLVSYPLLTKVIMGGSSEKKKEGAVTAQMQKYPGGLEHLLDSTHWSMLLWLSVLTEVSQNL